MKFKLNSNVCYMPPHFRDRAVINLKQGYTMRIYMEF